MSLRSACIALSCLAVSGATLLGPSLAWASPISGPAIIHDGGLTFSSFACTINTSPGGSPNACDQVSVGTLPGSVPGLRFSSGFSAQSSGGGSEFADAALSYDVTGTAGLHSIGLTADPFFMGRAVASVTETVYHNGTILGQGTVLASPSSTVLQTAIPLSGSYDNLSITKDIVASAAQGTSGISIIDQTYPGNGGATSVPEPGSLTLLTGALGLLAAGVRSKRT